MYNKANPHRLRLNGLHDTATKFIANSHNMTGKLVGKVCKVVEMLLGQDHAMPRPNWTMIENGDYNIIFIDNMSRRFSRNYFAKYAAFYL